MTHPDKLLECPFCGWDRVVSEDMGMERYRIKCNGCGASGGTVRGVQAAENQWNMRGGLPYKESGNGG